MTTLKGEAGNYPYACARVKARKTQLLPAETYPRMLNMDLAEISRFIGEGQYKREVDELASRYSGVDLVEHATYLNLVRTYKSVLGFTKGELNTILRHFLNRWDVYNFATVLRGRNAGVPWEEVKEEVVPAGAFDIDFFKALSGAADLEEMERILKKAALSYGFEPTVLKFLKDGQWTLPSPAELENELEKEYYLGLLGAIPETTPANKRFLEYLKAEIDTVNLKTLFKLKFEDVALGEVQKLIVPAGEQLGPPVLHALAEAKTFEDFLTELSGTRAWGSVREAAGHARGRGSLNEVLLALDRHLHRRAHEFSRIYPLSVLPVIDYLLKKKVEVDNIRTIARGKQGGLPEEEIRSLLLL